MGKYVFKRTLMLIPVMLGAVILVFTLLYFAQGDPAAIVLGESASPEKIEQMREEMGLNDPYLVQLFRYIANACKGDLGKSWVTGKSVTDMIAAVYPTTMKLAMLSITAATILGVLLGILSAVKQYSIWDNLLTGLALCGTSIPLFWWGMMIVLLFSVTLQWFPASGSYGVEYFVLPTITLVTAIIAPIIRMTRSSMLEVLRQDYIATARSKGQVERVVIFKHAFRNALIPIMTTVGIQLGSVLVGSVVTESVFAISGMGSLMINSISRRDFPVVQGCILVIAIMYTIINLTVDVLYAFVDPRVKSIYSQKKKRKEGDA